MLVNNLMKRSGLSAYLVFPFDNPEAKQMFHSLYPPYIAMHPKV